jgi:hypothetical protein
MNSKTISIETPYSPKELVEKLRAITITDFDHLHNSTHAVYYGDIKSHSFDIKNVRYSPMSSIPSIEGDIQEGVNHSIVKIIFNIEERYTMTKKMYYATLIPLGIIFLLLGLLVFSGTEYQMQGIISSSVFLICAFLIVAFVKMTLVNAKKREIKEFISRVDGKIITEIDN